ncbi:uncharacterized protein LOC123556607 isoform X2 [Mercenaria mercenaria]|uniref:uncharacterized protein LOC123556607 isoform X2 n=1 Tax=Mercenaria mercenaria TaxID=6596 RepID=UPI00234EB48B|nr:uncharacterized protein LOC123556607 isoform X2 [Mercenaria mercenaria]
MNFVILTLICIVLSGQKAMSSGFHFSCDSDNNLLKIELECSGNKRIHIVGAWNIRSKHKYPCKNNSMTFLEAQYSLTYEMTHKILTKCSYKRKCIVKLFPEDHGSNKHHGIRIKYACIPAVKFNNICHSTPTKRLSEVYLIDNVDGSNASSRCHCDLLYYGRFVVSLTHFPTEWVHLKVKTWTTTKSFEKEYRNQVYRRQTFYTNPNTIRQQFTVINNSDNRKDEPAFLLVNISAPQTYQSTNKQLISTVHPPQSDAPSATKYAVISAIITSICFLGICTSTFFIYRRIAIKKEIDSSRNNANMTSPGVVNTVERNIRRSVYVDCGRSLRHSYAEIGSISDYRHYVMPDETFMQSLKITSRFKTLVEESNSNNAHDNAGETSNGINVKQKSFQKFQGGHTNDKHCSGNHSGPGDVSDIVQDMLADNTTRLSHEMKTKPKSYVMSTEEETDNTNENKGINCSAKSTKQSNKESVDLSAKMIPNEHYDPSGYLDLDVPEKTSNANLMNWKKEVYSVEQMARAKRSDPLDNSENLNQVGKRVVTIVQKGLQDTPLGNQYDYTHNRVIMFSEDEPAQKLPD